MLGAVIWAVLTYFTLSEFGIVAWGLGGLAGLGMALGHEDDDGTFAGIIAAFMSIVGIVAAKVFIIIIFIAAFASSAVSEFEESTEQGGAAEFQRSALEEQGLDGEIDEEEDVAESAEPDEDPALADNDAAEPADDADEAVAEDDDEVTFGSVLGELFGPMDGFFILLAFFTAYKVGSGELGD